MTEHLQLCIAHDSPFARKLSAYAPLCETDLAALSELYRRRRTLPVGVDILYQGQIDQSAYVITSGWAASYKMLPDGARQIIDFHIPGDFIGLRSLLFRSSDHNVEPLTPIQCCEVFRSDIVEAFGRAPRLSLALLWAASRDTAMIVEHLVDLGRRSAGVRMAHFLLELGSRLSLVGMATPAGYKCPLSQNLLADALGLSVVHVNRVLRDLREARLVTFQRGRVTFHDYDALVQYAGFDMTYLDQARPLIP